MNWTDLLLFVLVVVQCTQIFLIKKWLDLNDFSKEDVSVKAMTERENQSAKQVAEAIAELPSQPTGKT